MPTLEENVNRVKAAKTAIGNAITAKGGTVGANDGLEDFAADIATIPSGGGSSQPRKDVNFYDYDGTIVNSYTAAEFAELSAMPANPTHDGLTAQGWNWSLSDAKTYVASYGKLEIGQMYVTSDGKTRLYITLTEGRTSPYLKLYLNENSKLDIDWGDGSTHGTLTSTTAGAKKVKHNYADAGDYVISITVLSGSFHFNTASTLSAILSNNNNSSQSPDQGYINAIRRIEIGSGVPVIGDYDFILCKGLTSITIPNSVANIGNYAFYNCYLLTSITIPNSVTSIGTNAFSNCYCLSSITIPNSIVNIGGYAMNTCQSLITITIPNSVASIGDSVFSNCYALKSIVITGSSSVTIGDNLVSSSSSCTAIIIGDSVASFGSSSFAGCASLTSITIPNSVMSIGNYAFQYCYSLAKITINKPEGSISGSPWGATTGSPTNTQIIWTGE